MEPCRMWNDKKRERNQQTRIFQEKKKHRLEGAKYKKLELLCYPQETQKLYQKQTTTVSYRELKCARIKTGVFWRTDWLKGGGSTSKHTWMGKITESGISSRGYFRNSFTFLFRYLPGFLGNLPITPSGILSDPSRNSFSDCCENHSNYYGNSLEIRFD